MKNMILLDHYYTPEELTARIWEWVEYYSHHRYHEAIDNMIPAGANIMEGIEWSWIVGKRSVKKL
jgi:transposase InsO family protein